MLFSINLILFSPNPITAAIAPIPRGTASCIMWPLFFTSLRAVSKSIASLATKAEYSPKLNPAVISAIIPLSFKILKIAIDVVKIAGWVFSVIFNASFSPLKIRFLISNPNTSLALSKTFLQTG